MANATVDTVGQVNGSGATDALFLKVFGGEVVTAFEKNCTMKDRVTARSISSGKSAQFPRFGRISAAYHTPGAEIVGLNQNWNEAVITIDDLLISHAFIANIDEAKSHYDVRSPISTEIGRALAYKWDQQLLQMAVVGARAANPVTGMEGGAQILTSNAQAPASADFMNNGGHLASALFLAAQAMDNSFVPSEGRCAFVRPAQYYALASTTNNINKFWGGMGAFSDGTVLRIAGFEIVKTTGSFPPRTSRPERWTLATARALAAPTRLTLRPPRRSACTRRLWPRSSCSTSLLRASTTSAARAP